MIHKDTIVNTLNQLSGLERQMRKVESAIKVQKDNLYKLLADHEEFLFKDLEKTDLVIKLTIEKPEYQKGIILTDNTIFLRVDRPNPKYDFGESLGRSGMNDATQSNLWPVDYTPDEREIIDILVDKMLDLGYSYCGEVFSNINFNTYKFIF